MKKSESEIEMKGVTEYCENMGVYLDYETESNREIIRAYNEAGYNWTEIDLLELLEWSAKNKPGLYMRFIDGKTMRQQHVMDITAKELIELYKELKECYDVKVDNKQG